LVIIAVLQTAQGKNNNLLKKIYKALKMPKESTYLQDIVDIANNKVMMQLLTFLLGCQNTPIMLTFSALSKEK
jgi:hypothetical protein